MRLGPFDPNNIRVRRGEGGGMGLPIGGGGIGCGTIVIALIAYFVFGADPSQFLGGMQGADQAGYSRTPGRQGNESVAQLCSENQYATEACNALSSLNQTWQPIFQQAGVAWHQPELVFYQGGTRSGCGAASASMGPFYCPGDRNVYIDLGFYDELRKRFGAGGDFAQAYVVAHEVGHHVQNLLGISDKVDAARRRSSQARSNALSVRMELQADCFAGVWANNAQRANQRTPNEPHADDHEFVESANGHALLAS